MKNKALVMVMCIFALKSLWAQETITLKMVGEEGKTNFNIEVLKRALEADGHKVQVRYLGTDYPTTRLEYLIETGAATTAILGETPERNAKLLPIKIAMTDGLMGKRILFIPKGSQAEYNKVKTLADFQALGKIAGMGTAWADIAIWEKNGLRVIGQPGDWKVLYRMVESRARRVDYLPRGALEILTERLEHDYLDVEQRLLLVYDKDSIVYVTPKDPRLKVTLERALIKARNSGLIRKTVAEFYRGVFEAPININKRTVIKLEVP